MTRDKIFGFWIAAGSVVVAIVMSQLLHYYEAGIRPEMYVLPALGFVVGLLVAFTDFESAINLDTVIEDLPEAFEDDMEDLKSGQITFPIIAALTSVAGVLVETGLIISFRKWNAEWFGGLNVLSISTIICIGVVYIFLRSEWFQNRYYRMEEKIFIIPFIGFVICLFLGVYYAEPQRYGELSPMEQDKLARSESYGDTSRGSQFFNTMGRSSGSSSDVDFDCDGDECVGFILFIVVVICVIGSALIPHFWLLATILLLTIMVMVALRALLYYEKKREYRW